MIQLPPMPATVAQLPRDERGYPVPWFVAWVNGKPEFRAAEASKFTTAIREHRCWVCGIRIVHRPTFVIGPMSAVNRTTAEPPCHAGCAEFSAMACPFLSMPKAKRREANMPDGDCAGFGIKRNPGCCMLWTCNTKREAYNLFGDGKGGYLFRLPEPIAVDCWAEGRPATRSEVLASMESGLPILRGIAEKYDGPEAVAMLQRAYDDAMRFLPAEAVDSNQGAAT